MRALVQRVGNASVSIGGSVTASIGVGLLVYCGVSASDSQVEIDWLARKIASLRIFDDAEGVMNRSVVDSDGEILAVSQFTLYASTRKGARPSYSAAAPPALALPTFESFVRALERECGKPVRTGVFGAHMRIESANDGPVTLWLDAATRE